MFKIKKLKLLQCLAEERLYDVTYRTTYREFRRRSSGGESWESNQKSDPPSIAASEPPSSSSLQERNLESNTATSGKLWFLQLQISWEVFSLFFFVMENVKLCCILLVIPTIHVLLQSMLTISEESNSVPTHDDEVITPEEVLEKLNKSPSPAVSPTHVINGSNPSGDVSAEGKLFSLQYGTRGYVLNDLQFGLLMCTFKKKKKSLVIFTTFILIGRKP